MEDPEGIAIIVYSINDINIDDKMDKRDYAPDR